MSEDNALNGIMRLTQNVYICHIVLMYNRHLYIFKAPSLQFMVKQSHSSTRVTEPSVIKSPDSPSQNHYVHVCDLSLELSKGKVEATWPLAGTRKEGEIESWTLLFFEQFSCGGPFLRSVHRQRLEGGNSECFMVVYVKACVMAGFTVGSIALGLLTSL